MYFCLQLSGAPVKLFRLWAAGGPKEEGAVQLRHWIQLMQWAATCKEDFKSRSLISKYL